MKENERLDRSMHFNHWEWKHPLSLSYKYPSGSYQNPSSLPRMHSFLQHSKQKRNMQFVINCIYLSGYRGAHYQISWGTFKIAVLFLFWDWLTLRIRQHTEDLILARSGFFSPQSQNFVTHLAPFYQGEDVSFVHLSIPHLLAPSWI